MIHFDITELSARLMRKKLIETFFIKKSFEVEYHKIIEEFKLMHDSIQNQYDLESKHHLNDIKQKEWNKKIAKELSNLENCKNPIISVYLNK